MKRCLAVILVFAATYSRAEVPPIMMGGDALRQTLLTHPRPDYPYEARLKHITGSGVFDLTFDYDTGRLREIHITTSTGHWILDKAAIAMFKDWQAKPHTVRKIRVPITFAMRH